METKPQLIKQRMHYSSQEDETARSSVPYENYLTQLLIQRLEVPEGIWMGSLLLLSYSSPQMKDEDGRATEVTTSNLSGKWTLHKKMFYPWNGNSLAYKTMECGAQECRITTLWFKLSFHHEFTRWPQKTNIHSASDTNPTWSTEIKLSYRSIKSTTDCMASALNIQKASYKCQGLINI